jgi:hypothetical protein
MTWRERDILGREPIMMRREQNWDRREPIMKGRE